METTGNAGKKRVRGNFDRVNKFRKEQTGHCFVGAVLQHALNVVERARVRRGDP